MRFIQNLFKPKWQHSNPSVRKQALLELDKDAVESQSIISEIATHDDVIELRQQAIRRLTDINLLADISRNDLQTDVQELARSIWYQYLTGLHELSPDIDDLVIMLDRLNDDKAVQHVALHGKTATLRLTAVKKVNRESLLGDISIHDKSLEIRLLALQQVQQKSTLERVYKVTRTKDKRISRESKERLNAILAKEILPSQLKEQRRHVTLTLEGLGKKGMWEREKDVFDRALKEWQTIDGEVDDAILERYEKAQAVFIQGYDEYLARQAERLAQDAKYMPIRNEKLQIIEFLEKLEGRFNQAATRVSPDDESAAGLENGLEASFADLEAANRRWVNLGHLPEEDEHNLQARFSPLYTQLRTKIQAQLDVVKADHRLEALFKHGQRLLTNRIQLTQKSIRDFESRWEAIHLPINYTDASHRKTHYQQTLSKLKSKLDQQIKDITNAEQALQTHLASLEQALAVGELKKAEDFRKKFQKLLNKLEKSSKSQASKWRKRLQDSTRGLNELSSWRNWANTPQKEKLCEQIEALIDSQENPLEIAQAIKVAQEEWKKLGPSERDSSQVLWGRFQKACEAAYEPCKAYFADQSVFREEALERRNAFLNKFDAFVSEADWDSIDWKKIEQLEHQARNEWRELGATDRKYKAKLNRRFNQSLKVLQSKIKVEWDKNQVKKQALVKEAQTLLDEPDLAKAINRCKALQSQWKKAGRISQKDEQALWKTFRGCCDIVFGRRDQQREDQIKAREAQIQKKTDICEQIERLGAINDRSILTMDAEYQPLLQAWRQCEPIDKTIDAEFARRFKAANTQYATQKLLQTKVQEIDKLLAMQAKASICEQLESVFNTHGTTEQADELIAPLDNEWANSMALDTPYETLLNERYTHIKQFIAQPSDHESWLAYQQTNDETLATLCVKLEILAGIESPKHAAAARLKLQVERLSTEMGSKESYTDQWQQFIDLQAQWLSVGFVTEDEREAIMSRRSNIIQTFKTLFPNELKIYPV